MIAENRAIVLACDVDDTLLSVDSRKRREREASTDALEKLCDLVEHERRVRPVYFGSATGRSLASHREREGQSPALKRAARLMDFMITAAGSEIALVGKGRPARLSDWPEAAGWSRDTIVRALIGRAELTMQPEAGQGPHKVSFDVRGVSDNVHGPYVADITRELAAQDITAQVLFSGGIFLDVLPLGVNKGTALTHTVGELALMHHESSVPPFVIAAGDSMNDCDLLRAADGAILPGNAQDSLRQWAQDHIAPSALYIANDYFAGGVLQGYRHFVFST